MSLCNIIISGMLQFKQYISKCQFLDHRIDLSDELNLF